MCPTGGSCWSWTRSRRPERTASAWSRSRPAPRTRGARRSDAAIRPGRPRSVGDTLGTNRFAVVGPAPVRARPGRRPAAPDAASRSSPRVRGRSGDAPGRAGERLAATAGAGWPRQAGGCPGAQGGEGDQGARSDEEAGGAEEDAAAEEHARAEADGGPRPEADDRARLDRVQHERDED